MKPKEFTGLLIRLTLGLIYMTAGLSKLSPDYLGNIIGPVDAGKIFQSDTMQVFMIVTAIYQVIAGVLILSQRYSVLGLILVFPLALGILIFTIFAGFAGTPFINLLILLLLIYVLVQEKTAVKRLFAFSIEGIQSSAAYTQFPGQRIPAIALGLIVLTMCLSFLHTSLLNVLTTVSLLLFTVNVYQAKNYLLIDKVMVWLFFIIGFIIINGLLLNKIIPKAFYSVFMLIPLGLVLYLIRLVYSAWLKHKSITS